MLRSILVGLDGSAYSAAAVELGIRWAQHFGAVLVGLGIIDAPTICKPQPVPLGASAYKVHHDATLLADANHKVAQLLADCAQRCAEAGVTCHILQDTGLPAAQILLEAQHYDLIMLGQQTYFHFETQHTPDETLAVTEGIETALAVRCATGLPVWATSSAGGMARLIVPPDVRLVIICADNDPPGIKAARALARRLLSEQRRAKILPPDTPGTDWADRPEVSHV